MNEQPAGQWQLITTDVEFDALGTEWDELFVSNPDHRPFQSRGWVSAWREHLAGDHDLQVACWRDNDRKLQFVLPLIRSDGNGRFRNRRLVNMCGYGPECSDHASCLRHPSLNDSIAQQVADAISLFFPENARVELGNLDAAHDFPQKLCSEVRRFRRFASVNAVEHCPAVDLASSWDDYLGRFSANFRSQTRRHHKRVLNSDVFRFRSADSDEAEDFARALIRLNRSRIGEKGKVSSLEDPGLRKFLLDVIPYLAKNNLAWMDVIENNSEIVAAALNLKHGRTAYFYMGGFAVEDKKIRPGTALFARVIARAIEQGFETYDFLRGADAYKYRWGAENAPIYSLKIYSNSPLIGAVQIGADRCRDGAKAAVRRLRMTLARAQ